MTRAADGQSVQLTDGTQRDTSPTWSPDGKWVAFAANRDGALRVLRVSASGADVERLTADAGRTPRWSPDGKHLYFIGLGDRAGDVWSLSLDSGQEQRVTALSGRRGALGVLGLATDGDRLEHLERLGGSIGERVANGVGRTHLLAGLAIGRQVDVRGIEQHGQGLLPGVPVAGQL